MYPVYRPYLSGKEQQYVSECLDSSWISSRGDFIRKFEIQFADFVGVRHATTVCNGTVALHLAMLAIGIGPGDEVIVPTLTYVASANMIVQTGATPVFVDSIESTWQIDPSAVKRAITPRTKAVMVVHLYGASCDMEAICKICTEHGLLLIEDCAEAFGTFYRDKHVGTFGDVSTFSFFGNKTITTGEGGMVVSNNAEVLNKAYHLKTQAVSPSQEYWHDTVGYNYRMTNICAAIGFAQLEQANYVLERKQQLAAWYDRYLVDLPVRRQAEPPRSTHSWWLYSILVSQELRDSLRLHLRNRAVETRPLFPPVHAFPHYECGLEFPVAQCISKSGLSLPSYPDLTESDVQIISSKVREFFEVREGCRTEIADCGLTKLVN
ncbi:DegT/DnrJ/EryC1/StrS family aminotransferase [Bradyrhizobium japonicum]|uniref:DegT/DnrJ/EryC1/StrS family aminotransferase n=1 Tax=Bradyrhizobium japonicum TaxID=375 RepID=UPI001BAC5BF8|nr:DegT/DnrJ/EryC1/StrS aminotransferase family protein [Bradyrhizobium japonicum]MBR0914907.1 DegT/DnrJ/EryC1/StrS aminotransferase family protein [Bradyrhizobium japonicum]